MVQYRLKRASALDFSAASCSHWRHRPKTPCGPHLRTLDQLLASATTRNATISQPKVLTVILAYKGPLGPKYCFQFGTFSPRSFSSIMPRVVNRAE